MNATTVNVPLLRKAIEWAEAEAAKPIELSQWHQQWVQTAPEEIGRSAECGTCYCLAGYLASLDGIKALRDLPDGFGDRLAYAQDMLGMDWDSSRALFDSNNTIADVRRIAESIAGERL